ncbi:MAG: YigZ family protein [Proteobacteria bacterium]|uniref:YigZ family protein n=1 Tax=Candidatus Avisuccinivibrio stercorigallinarum TaxID=2840704 RepID=A0A9D9DB72_9GAMM|nr:YigZ family protein [Candidatus Avisuccinivibrio stercorigallinarum]
MDSAKFGAHEIKQKVTMAAAEQEDTYLVPDLKAGAVHVNEIIIKRSRFITTIGHTAGAAACREFIDKISAQYADATHNCYAFNGTKPESTAVCGCSDDGEPHGTAGQPMLNVVLHCGIGELTAVVTRYFGGILLGTGGLVKAYQDSVKEALQTLPVTERLIPAQLELEVEHQTVGVVLYQLPFFRAEVLEQDFAQRAHFVLRLPKSRAAEFAALIKDKSRGRALIKIDGQDFV